jgi:hypothetical protein
MYRRLLVLSGLPALVLGASVGCGGSSSETPPPLEPTPANVHYDRSATTLPGELGSAPPAGAAGAAGRRESSAGAPEPRRERGGHDHEH